jgi:hypothetical protein
MVQADLRDRMILGMAHDAARVKSKAREARHKRVRQSGYCKVRYQRFQGRRDEAMEEETREAYRARVRRSIQTMAGWLESQARANAEEGRPRYADVEDSDGLEDVPLSRFVAQAVVVVPTALLVEGPINPWEPVMRATVVGNVPLLEAVATLVTIPSGTSRVSAKTVAPAGREQSLITSFFTRGKVTLK